MARQRKNTRITDKTYLRDLARLVTQELGLIAQPGLEVMEGRPIWDTYTDGYEVTVARLAGGGSCELWNDRFTGLGVRTVQYCFASSKSARMKEIAAATAELYADSVLRRTSRDADFHGEVFRLSEPLPRDELGIPIWESYSGEHYCGVYMQPREGGIPTRKDAVTIAHFFARVAERLRQPPSTRVEAKPEEEDAAISAAEAEIEAAGQGFLLDSELRRMLELYGMGKAKTELTNRFPKHVIVDVSADMPYDFQCSRGKDRVFVEVKCTQSNAAFVLLSRREVEHARRFPAKTALIVVRSVKLKAGKPTGGAVEVFYPWDIRESKLVPIGFSCTLKRKSG